MYLEPRTASDKVNDGRDSALTLKASEEGSSLRGTLTRVDDTRSRELATRVDTLSVGDGASFGGHETVVVGGTVVVVGAVAEDTEETTVGEVLCDVAAR